jgi:hypothetical protein
MAKYERANHDHDRDERVFDGGDDDDGSEGSHLPVVIIIAILVLAAFGGVVWLAYNQGVARGRTDVPVRVASTQPAKTDGGIKVFQQRAGAEEDGSAPAAAAPAPQAAQTPDAQTPAAQNPAAQTPATQPPAAAQAQTQAPPAQAVPVPAPPPAKIVTPKTAAQTPTPQQAPPPADKPKPQQVAAAKPVPSEQPQAATKPPAALGGVHATAAPKVEPLKPAALKPADTAKPAAPAKVDVPVKPAVSGSYLLQIGAYKSDEEARAAWKADAAKHATLLNGFGPDVQRFEKPDGSTWYRLRFGSFADRSTAAALCERLKAQGRDCLVVK